MATDPIAGRTGACEVNLTRRDRPSRDKLADGSSPTYPALARCAPQHAVMIDRPSGPEFARQRARTATRSDDHAAPQPCHTRSHPPWSLCPWPPSLRAAAASAADLAAAPVADGARLPRL